MLFTMGENENAPAGNRTRVASMEGLNDTITLLVPWTTEFQMYALAMLGLGQSPSYASLGSVLTLWPTMVLSYLCNAKFPSGLYWAS